MATIIADDSCRSGSDNDFGPRVAIACRAFDFTLLFEDAFFTALPAALFLILVPWRMHLLGQMPTRVASYRLATYKVLLLFALLIGHVFFLVFRLQSPSLHTKFALPSSILSIIAITVAGAQSFIEDQRSLNPSDMLVLYFSVSIILAVPHLRTLWLIRSSNAANISWTVIFILTIATLAIESTSKSRLLRPLYKRATKEQTVGFWSRTFFFWVLPFFQSGFSHVLHLDEIPAVDDALEEEVNYEKLEAAWQGTSGHHRLILSTLKANKMPFLSGVAPRLALSVFTFCQPFLIESFVAYMSTPKMEDNGRYGHALVGAFVLVYLGMTVSRAVYWRQTYRLIARIRCGLIAKMYRHTTTLKASELRDSAAVTLMGTDVERIVESLRFVHQIWVSIPEVAVAVWLLARQVSVASVLPVVICIASVAMTSAIARRYGPAQKAWVECVQQRIAVTTSMLLNMKAVKILGLTNVLHDVVSGYRKVELKTSESFRSLLTWQIVVSNAPEHLAPFATFAVYAIIAAARKETLLSSQAFASLSLVTLLTNALMLFCQALPACIQGIACFSRIEAYFNMEEPASEVPSSPLPSPSLPLEPLYTPWSTRGPPASPPPKSALFSFESADIAWSPNAAEANLRELNVTISSGFTAIIGRVGSGKSTLLASLIGETTILRGASTPFFRRAAFCSQTAWIMDNTIRHNITGGLAFDQKWFDYSTFTSCLQEDLEAMPGGDQTVTGSNGMSLSGGQRQRLALARAVYSRLPVVILDDVMSGLDPTTAGTINTRLFSRDGHFRRHGISVVIATQDSHILPHMDVIVTLDEGRIVEYGTYGEIRLKIPNLEEEIGAASPLEEIFTEARPSSDVGPSGEPSHPLPDEERTTVKESESWKRDGSWSVYTYYYDCAGGFSVFFWALATLISAVSANFAPIWLQKWVAANERAPGEPQGLYIGVYAVIFVISLAAMTAECWQVALVLFVRIINDTAFKLHEDLLVATLKAPFDFFLATDIGAITNRFSQDMDLIDMALPTHAIQFTTGAVACVVQLIILCVLGKYLAATIPLLATALFLVQRYYLRTSRQLRLIDIEAKSPLYKQFIEAISGAPTIRALGWKAAFYGHHAELLNRSQRPFYMLYCVQQWLVLVLDLIVGALAVLLVTIATSLAGAVGPGSLGVGLVLLLSFNALLTQAIQAWTRMETSIGAVARVQRFLETTPREPEGSVQASPEWPDRGTVRFDNVTAYYVHGTTPVLQNLTLAIAAGEKIALCGSSGSGKSSLLMSLLQMTFLETGSITIDGIDISKIESRELRSRINVVPQEPLFLPGTVRFNLDPRARSTDTEIEAAIRKVALWDRIAASGGLGAALVEAEWSRGESQLLCLARALLVPSRILILDEATSSFDEKTEAVFQSILDNEFQEQTVISVLHRYDYIDRYDRVAVLDRGMLVECGSPRELLLEDTSFRRLYAAYTGH